MKLELKLKLGWFGSPGHNKDKMFHTLSRIESGVVSVV